mgnify:CR=1 FL=1
MSTKMDDKIESLYEKEIEAKISYEGYARLDEALYTEFTAKSFLKALKRDSIKVVKMGVNHYIFDENRVKTCRHISDIYQLIKKRICSSAVSLTVIICCSPRLSERFGGEKTKN